MYARKHTTPFSFKSTEERSLCPLLEYYSFLSNKDEVYVLLCFRTVLLVNGSTRKIQAV